MRRWLVALAVVVAAGALPVAAQAAPVTQDLKFTASDGAQLQAIVAGEGDLRPRPTIVEFTPYAEGCCDMFAGPAYNYVKVHARGGEVDNTAGLEWVSAKVFRITILRDR